MKKFIKSSVVLLLILGSLGTYYVQSAMITSDLPRYQIEHLSGNEELIEDLIIQGQYMDEKVSDRYLLTDEGIEYMSDLNLVERFEGQYNRTVKRLRDEYPGFMRGTRYVHNNLYEDENVLVLSDEKYEYLDGEQNHRLDISILNKETKVEKNFSVSVEDMGHVIELQYMNNNIHFFIKTHDSSSERYKIEELVVSTESGELESQKTVVEGKQVTLDNQYASLNKLRESVNYSPMNFIVIRDQLETLEEGKDGLRSRDRKEDLLAYNIETGNVEKLDLPPEEYGYAAMFEGEYLYFEDYSDDGQAIIKPYDIANGEFLDSITVSADEQNSNSLKAAKEGMLYIINQSKIEVVDIESGEIVYEGDIVSNDDQDLEHISIDYIEFR